MFVRYAVGDSDTFPHWESVSMAISGQPVLSIDDIAAALSNRKIWKICPADWDVYGASSCPVDPITNAVVNDALLVYSAEYGNVMRRPEAVRYLADAWSSSQAQKVALVRQRLALVLAC